MSAVIDRLRAVPRRAYARSVVESPWLAALLRRWWVVLVLLGSAVAETVQDALDRSWWTPADLLVVALLAGRLAVLLHRRRGGRGGASGSVGEWWT